MSGDKPQSAVLRIKLRYKSIDAFVEKFAENVSHGGIFISTKQLKPVGTDVRFELLLADGAPAVKGEGRVAFIKEPDPDEPQSAFGMGIKVTKLAGKSREVLKKCLEWKAAHKKSAEVEGATDKIPIHTGQFELPEAKELKVELPEDLEALAAEAGLDDAKLVAALEHLRAQATNGVGSDVELDELLKKEPLLPVSVDAATAELARMLGGAPVAKRKKARHPLADAHDTGDEDEASALTPPPVNVPLPDLDVSLYREEERPAVALTPSPKQAPPAVPVAEIGAEVASVLDALEHELNDQRDTHVDSQTPLFVGRGVVSEGTPLPVDPAQGQTLYDDVPETRVRQEGEVTPPPTEPTPPGGPEKRKSGFFKKLFGK